MGIRIHKMMGYGFDDVQVENHTLIDQRFNLDDGWLAPCLSRGEQKEKYSRDNFLSYLKSVNSSSDSDDILNVRLEIGIIEGTFLGPSEPIKEELYHCIKWGTEYLDSNVLCVTPYTFQDWIRFDNTMDYYENPSQENHLQILDRPLYPHDSYINLKNMMRWYETEDETRFAWHNIMMVYRYLKEQGESQEEINQYVQVYGFDNEEDMHKNLVPCVPAIVIHMMNFVKMFKDERTAYTLKPMIYTYWS